MDVFLRYGYARTTMGDIAEGARISRPALYLVFPRKDDIFAAVIGRMSADNLQEMRTALPALSGLASKLHFCCESWGAHGYDLTEAHPDARDIFDLAFVPVREMYAAFETFLADLLAEVFSRVGIKVYAARTGAYSHLCHARISEPLHRMGRTCGR